jgi:hypothetical protein
MSKQPAVREAQLKPEWADHYPSHPARMWTSAALLAKLVESCRRGRSSQAGKGRTLPDAEFRFRGGARRWLGGLIARTRIGEASWARGQLSL